MRSNDAHCVCGRARAAYAAESGQGTQFESDKKAFNELKAKGITKVETNLSKGISEVGQKSKSWLSKFN